MKIISVSNPRVKQVVKLRSARSRKTSNLTIVEGQREIETALKAGVPFSDIFWCPSQVTLPDHFLAALSKQGCSIFEVPDAVYQKMAFGERKEGLLGVCRCPSPSGLDGIDVGKETIVVIERVEKPGNLGAILRTCDAAGVKKVVVADPATDIYNPNVIRASLGAVFCVQVFVGHSEEIISCFKKQKVRLIIASPDGKQIYTQADLTGKTALVLGSEDAGVSSQWLKAADSIVRVPMRGTVNSLNVSTCAAILIYEAVRQRCE